MQAPATAATAALKNGDADTFSFAEITVDFPKASPSLDHRGL
jgi:hypothetical protein